MVEAGAALPGAWLVRARSVTWAREHVQPLRTARQGPVGARLAAPRAPRRLRGPDRTQRARLPRRPFKPRVARAVLHVRARVGRELVRVRAPRTRVAPHVVLIRASLARRAEASVAAIPRGARAVLLARAPVEAEGKAGGAGAAEPRPCLVLVRPSRAPHARSRPHRRLVRPERAGLARGQQRGVGCSSVHVGEARVALARRQRVAVRARAAHAQTHNLLVRPCRARVARSRVAAPPPRPARAILRARCSLGREACAVEAQGAGASAGVRLEAPWRTRTARVARRCELEEAWPARRARPEPHTPFLCPSRARDAAAAREALKALAADALGGVGAAWG
eukprot:814153-Rhodomonas_salina.2